MPQPKAVPSPRTGNTPGKNTSGIAKARGKRQTITQDPVLRKARLEQTIEMRLRGMPVPDIAKVMNVTPETLRLWTNEAKRKGLIDSVRERMTERLMPLSEAAYETILKADPDELTKRQNVKAHTLKLKAAKEIMDGLGGFQKHQPSEVKTKQTMNMEGYYALRAQRQALGGGAAAVEGEVLALPAPAEPE